MKDPLKQGLKHEETIFFIRTPLVEVKDPLKQGLKHYVKFIKTYNTKSLK